MRASRPSRRRHRRRSRSVARQLAVGDAVRTGGLRTEALDLGALVGEDVRRDAVEEPPVVGDDDGAAGELEQRVLEGAEGLDVEVVGRLVEEQQVAALLEREREVETVALTTGEDARELLLVGALEAELRHVGP